MVAVSLLASISWAPYAYAYLNPIAGANKDGLSWELDYWGVSGKEGVERLRKLGYTPVSVTPTDGVGIPWGAAHGAPKRGTTVGLYVFLRGDLTIRRRTRRRLRVQGRVQDHAGRSRARRGRSLSGVVGRVPRPPRDVAEQHPRARRIRLRARSVD